MSRTLIAGNWKMNGLRESLSQVEAVAAAVGAGEASVTALLCLPATLVALGRTAAGNSALRIGGETCHPNEKGAHTGDISAEMLKDAGACHVIVGHSERRADHGETDSVVAAQASAARRAGLEPIWASGTGKGANTDQIAEVHGAIRAWLAGRFDASGAVTPILYGGSMNPANAAEILAVPNVNGGLIGGASLKADDFLSIYRAAI